MKNVCIVFVFLLTFTACQETPEVAFEQQGVRFTSPKGWEISDEEDLEGEGYFLCIEKDGFDSSGIITVSWLNEGIDFKEWININKEELENNFIYKNTDFAFDAARKGFYNGNPTTAYDLK